MYNKLVKLFLLITLAATRSKHKTTEEKTQNY